MCMYAWCVFPGVGVHLCVCVQGCVARSPSIRVSVSVSLHRKGAFWVVGTILCACNCHVIPGVCVCMEPGACLQGCVLVCAVFSMCA